MLVIGAHASHYTLDLCFGHIDSPDVYKDSDFAELRELGVAIRPFQRNPVPAHLLAPILASLGLKPTPDVRSYWNFNDGISNFEDCDFWLIVSDRIQHPIPPHRPYAVVVYDYIQRYVPEIFGVDSKSASNWKMFDVFARATRDAQFVVCTTDQTRLDCINYAGASASRVFKFPMEFDPIGSDAVPAVCETNQHPPYLLWTTNSTQHKNHSRLNIHMTGVYTHLFDSAAGKFDKHYDDEYPRRVRKAIADSSQLRSRLRVLGNLSDDEYLSELQSAYGVLHGALYDNGTYSIVEAAWYGIPSISSDYPAIREACANFSMAPVLFNPYEPKALTESLERFVRDYALLKACLPPRDELRHRTFSIIAPEYWQTFLNALTLTRQSNA